MLVDTKEIGRCVRLFKNMDPRVYEKFIRLVDHRVTELTVAVTEASPDQILICQGRAQEARKMFQILTELPEDDPQQSVKRPGP